MPDVALLLSIVELPRALRRGTSTFTTPAPLPCDGVKADLPAGKQLPFLYSTKDVPPAPPMRYTPTPPAEETPRAGYELDPALIQLVGVLCLIGGCLGLVVYAILSIDE